MSIKHVVSVSGGKDSLATLRPMAQAARKGGGINLDWARRIVAKADAGVKVNMLPLKMAREALGRRGLAHQQGAH